MMSNIKIFKICNKNLPIRGKYATISEKKCQLEFGHSGLCQEFPYLDDLKIHYPRVANKIIRDSTKTTGAAWKSEDAGPNRIDRWIMLKDDNVLIKYGVNMQNLKPGVIAKLREKAATYDECMAVAAKLTWLAYQMSNAPSCPTNIKKYLQDRFGNMNASSTQCIICKELLDFRLFDAAKRGKAEIETAHSNPREHQADNVGFAHRECNIAQGNKSLADFYRWIEGILYRVRQKQ
jgi:hypothetical protein